MYMYVLNSISGSIMFIDTVLPIRPFVNLLLMIMTRDVYYCVIIRLLYVCMTNRLR